MYRVNLWALECSCYFHQYRAIQRLGTFRLVGKNLWGHCAYYSFGVDGDVEQMSDAFLVSQVLRQNVNAIHDSTTGAVPGNLTATWLSQG